MEKKYPKGLFANKPHENAPSFVKLNLSIHKTTFIESLSQLEADEKGYVRFQVKEGRDGKFYAEQDTYKKSSGGQDPELVALHNNAMAEKKKQEEVIGEGINPDDIPF